MEQKTQFYEIGLCPAIASLFPEAVSDWALTYDDLLRAERLTGHMSYQTKILPSYLVAEIANQIRANLAKGGVVWAKNFFFTHTVTGLRHNTQHTMDPQEALVSLEEFLSSVNLSLDATECGQWWIDVGLEVSPEEQMCLQWRTSSHSHLVQEILGISNEDANCITTLGGSKYSRDVASLLMAVSGCRIEPGSQAMGEYQAAYFQLYTTDKAITCNPEGGYHGKAITTALAMGPRQPPPFIEGLLKLFTSAMDRNASNARVEVRVPLHHATDVLTRLDLNVLRNSLLTFRRSDWWYVYSSI